MYVIELASQTVQRLTGAEGELGSAAPDWSPDGTEIVYEKFISNGGGLAHKNIYLMRANGEQQHPLLPRSARRRRHHYYAVLPPLVSGRPTHSI